MHLKRIFTKLSLILAVLFVLVDLLVYPIWSDLHAYFGGSIPVLQLLIVLGGFHPTGWRYRNLGLNMLSSYAITYGSTPVMEHQSRPQSHGLRAASEGIASAYFPGQPKGQSLYLNVFSGWHPPGGD